MVLPHWMAVALKKQL